MEKVLVNFLYAGSSALLLSISQLFPELWFVSFFALTPFLWRIIKTDFLDAIVLGAVLATAYCLISSPTLTLTTATEIIPKLIGLNILFIFFGAAANRISKHIGFNAIFIAILWLPLEYLITHYTGSESIFKFSNSDSTFLIKFGSLFGLLMISFTAVLINALILHLINLTAKILTSSGFFLFKGTLNNIVHLDDISFIIGLKFFLPNRRAPPKPHSCMLN